MFLNKKFKNMSIKNKIFFVSTSGIIIGFIILYIGLYLILPQGYKLYKYNLLKKDIENLLLNVENSTYSVDTFEYIDRFSYENGVFIEVLNKNKEIIYSSRGLGVKDKNFPSHDNRLSLNEDDKVRKLQNFHYERNFSFRNTTSDYKIVVDAMIPVKYETKNLLRVFFPIIIVTIVVIAVTISSFYSKIISKPLLDINRKAKKMSNLDFSERFYPKGKDEIAELSNSLNVMCDNLYKNIKMLEEANEKLRDDIDKERKIQKERKEFIATISHELKSPITVISGQLEGMIYNIGKYKDRDKYLKESYEVTKEMERLVMELLELSRRDKEDFKLVKKEINISKMIKEILRDNYYFIENKGLKLNENIKDNVIIWGDNRLLKKAFFNIIRNAIIHSPQGEYINIDLSKDELVVENTGVNIDKNEIENIFNAFYRVDKSRNSNTGGTGLGLYIVKSIFDKHEDIEYGIESKEKSVLFGVKFHRDKL